MQTTLSEDATREIVSRLREGNEIFTRAFPGEPEERQPVHTVYGGAQLFKHDMAAKLGAGARAALDEYAPDFVTFARAVGLPGADSLPADLAGIERLEAALATNPAAVRAVNDAAWLAHAIYTRVRAKLEREPVEDFRIDFEDGFGTRPDAEEDAAAVRGAEELAKGIREGIMCPFYGIRIKSFAEETRGRLSVGMEADFTALSVDPVEDAPEALVGAKVLATVVAGKDVYRAPGY